MDSRKEKFRSAIGGYNKEDVNNYIEEISRKYFNDIAELEKKSKILEKKITELEEEFEAISISEQEKVSKTEYNERVAELTRTVELLKADNHTLSCENNELADKLAEYTDRNQAANEAFEKSAKYDQVSAQIGSMIVSANARAESIVTEAELKARLSSKAMVDTTMERLNDINNKYTGEIIAKALQLAEDLRALSLSAESFRTDTKSAIETDCILLKEYLEKTKRIILEDNNE